MTKNKKSSLILVDNDFVGIVGLDEIFEDIYLEGEKPEGSFGKKLLSLAKKNNYIPAGGKGQYQEALLREYRNFYEEKKKGLKDKEVKKKDNAKELSQHAALTTDEMAKDTHHRENRPKNRLDIGVGCSEWLGSRY
ncbi:MAG: hypothetical protein AMJ90_06945 [candidate division Zixibacteria bacterium SM23_73_2]|nr:MAG: hypothetical protein AMJ90_06945 [candidate division Zixibacteria bacterium SM23_73_2]